MQDILFDVQKIESIERFQNKTTHKGVFVFLSNGSIDIFIISCHLTNKQTKIIKGTQKLHGTEVIHV